MKAVLFIAAAAAVVLAGAPAATQEAAPAPRPDSGTPNPPTNVPMGSPYLPHSVIQDRDCHDLSRMAAATRTGDTLFLQTERGAIFRMELVEPCDGVEAADKIVVRNVCGSGGSQLKLSTSTGPRSCKVRQVRRLTGPEVAAIAKTRQR